MYNLRIRIAFFFQILIVGVIVAQPVVTFRADVDKLRLRAAPDKNAAVVAELPEHTQLTYLGQTAGSEDQITLRGQAHKARWYQVNTTDANPKTGWVYGGAVVVSSVFLSENDQLGDYKSDFLEISPISEAAYETTFKNQTARIRYNTTQVLSGVALPAPVVLEYQNGKADTLRSRYDEENTELYRLRGEWQGTYVVEVQYAEMGQVLLYDQRTGRRVVSRGFSGDLPQPSPDAKWLAMSWTTGFADESEGGVQVFAVLPDGVFESMLLAAPQLTCKGLCWDAAGAMCVKIQANTPENPNEKLQFYRILIPRR
jgi:hypothetical protein